jgi:hypothetical protein
LAAALYHKKVDIGTDEPLHKNGDENRFLQIQLIEQRYPLAGLH